MSAIKITKGDFELEYKRFNFPAGEFYLKDRATWQEVENCELKEVFRNGRLLIDQSLSEIRNRINSSI